jgi:hypothetical protein
VSSLVDEKTAASSDGFCPSVGMKTLKNGCFPLIIADKS